MISMVYFSPMSFGLLKINPLWISHMPRLIMPPTPLLIVAITMVAGVVVVITMVQAVAPSPTLNGILVVVGVVGIPQIDPLAKFVTNRVMLL